MLRLNTFGGISLQRENGERTSLEAQRQLLGLLAMLAVSGLTGVLRERVLATLWPESTEEQARNALRQALFRLRRELGDRDAVKGTAILRLDPDALASDVAEFQAAMVRADYEKAAELYRGRFLGEFYLRNAPEFERWLDEQQRTFAEQNAVALRALAAARERGGDDAGAVKWWRRLAAHDRTNSGVAISLMRALDASGDRAGALAAARVHETILREELGIATSAEFQREVQRLEQPEVLGSLGVSRPDHALPNRSPPGGPPAQAATSPARASREGGSALPRERVRSRWSSVLSSATARPVWFVPAAVGLLALLLVLRAARSGDPGVPASEPARSAESGSVGSVSANGAFEAGGRFVDRGRLDSAAVEFRRAAELAPQFAPAHLWHAQVLTLMGDPYDEAYAAAARAVAMRHTEAPNVQLHAEALLALLDRDYPRACSLYRRLVPVADSLRIVPWYAWWGLGECNSKDRAVVADGDSPSGWKFRGSFEAGLRAYQKALDLSQPRQKDQRAKMYAALDGLLQTRYRSGRSRDAAFSASPSVAGDSIAFVAYTIQDHEARRPGTVPATRPLAEQRLKERRRELTARWAKEMGQSAAARWAHALALEAVGEISGARYGEVHALQEVAAARSLTSNPDTTLLLAVAEVRLHVKDMNWARAKRVADSLLSNATASKPHDAQVLAPVAALVGQVNRAAALAQRSVPDEPPSPKPGAVEPDPDLERTRLALLTFVGFGEPLDTLDALYRKLERGVDASPGSAAQKRELRSDVLREVLVAGGWLLSRAASTIELGAGPRRQITLQQAAARKDRGRVVSIVRQIAGERGNVQPRDLAPEALIVEAEALASVGEVDFALAHIAPYLDNLLVAPSTILDRSHRAAAVVRLMALRAELAERMGDRASARSWASAVATLWAGADDALRGKVARMRAIGG